jgi:hypothetical protein
MGMPKRTEQLARVESPGEGMHVCPGCRSGLVQPVQWFEQDDRRWQVELRCPDCGWRGRGSFSQDEVDRFDEELDHGAQELINDLRSVTRANMEEEIRSFTEALVGDRILPEDF